MPDIRFEAGKFICDGRIVSSEQQGSVPTSMLFKHRLPKPDRPPPIKKFLSEAKVVSALHSLANGSSPIQTHGASSRSEEIPPKTKCGFRLDGNREYRVPRGGLNSMKRGTSFCKLQDTRSVMTAHFPPEKLWLRILYVGICVLRSVCRLDCSESVELGFRKVNSPKGFYFGDAL